MTAGFLQKRLVDEMALQNTQDKLSLWDVTTGTGPAGEEVQDGQSFDVIIIGAGITGVTAALTLVEQGANVALVEATAPGAGATGRSGGYIVPAFSSVSPNKVIQENGEAGERLVSIVAESADLVFSFVQEHQIECAAQQGGWFQPAKSEKSFAQLQENAAVWQAFGAHGALLDAETTERLTGTKGYVGSWQASAGGTLHPVKLVHGLLSRAIEKGLHYFSQIKALEISQNATTRKIKTNKGNLQADTVLVCSNAKSPQLNASVYNSVIPVQVWHIATQIIPKEQRRNLLRQGQCLTDTQINLFSYRFDNEWRLISGSIPTLSIGDGRRAARAITRRLAQELSLSTEPKAEFIWKGELSVTPDFLPRLFDLGTGVYAITACNGRGLAVSLALGKKIAQAVLTRSFTDVPLLLEPPEHVKARSLKMLGTRLYPIYGSIRDFFKI